MKLPSRIVDLSVTLDNDIVLDPPPMRSRIEYRSNRENAPMLLESFPGLRPEDIPNGEGWSIEFVSLSTHNGTHMDAPIHYQSKSITGEPMMTIEQIPLEWCMRPGVKLDFRGLPDGYIVQPEDIERELERIGHALQPLDIVLVNTRAASLIGTDEYLSAGIGMGREATLYLTSRGVRVTGIDAWGWDAPFSHTRKRWEATGDPSIVWEGHYAGRETPYCHMEKLCNLDKLPATGFTVACFPCKIRNGSGGWVRAVALFD